MNRRAIFTFLSSRQEPFAGFRVVLLDAFTGRVHHSHDLLRGHVPAPSRLKRVLKRQCRILGKRGASVTEELYRVICSGLRADFVVLHLPSLLSGDTVQPLLPATGRRSLAFIGAAHRVGVDGSKAKKRDVMQRRVLASL